MTVRPPVKRKRKVKRHLRKSIKYSLIALAAAAVLITAFVQIPKMGNTRKLKELGYSKESIAVIKEEKLAKQFISEQLYSDNLNQVLQEGTFDKTYLSLYLVTSSLSDDQKLLYDRLKERNYPEDSCMTLFKELQFWEITPLLVFDYVSDVEAYVKDCHNHRDVNGPDHFELDGSYVVWYDSYEEADRDNLNMLVSKQNELGEDFIPADLMDLPLTYAAKGCSLTKEAADAFIAMCNELNQGGRPRMYASSSYRNYQYQVDIYNSYVNAHGQEWADSVAARPGYSEHQTGLAVDVAANNAHLSKFEEAEEFQWMQENAARFGWILRYPKDKKTITGYDYEAWHYRYVGPEIAPKVVASGLTYDEYYELYLR